MSPSNAPIISAWRRRAREALTAAGAPPQEAQWILDTVTGEGAAPPADRPLSSEEVQALDRCLRRRLAGEPLQYVLGVTQFMDLTLRTTPAALIPRPETEGLVERVLRHLPAEAEGWVADVGTGTGCIALAILHARPGLRAVATDISPAALALAQENAVAVGLASRVEWRQGDGAHPLMREGRTFLALVSNPPYVAPEEKSLLPREVVDFEPEEALFSSDHGLAHIKGLIAAAPGILSPGGLLALEIGETQGQAVGNLLEPGPWEAVRIDTDLAGKTRYALAERRREDDG